MSRLIDAEKLDFVSYQGIPDGYKDSFDSGVLYAMNLIDNQPIIDAVPVVRCGECRHKYLEHDVWRCLFGLLIPSPDGFCSYGEKVTE